ncbi:hypothetical protein DZF91_34970 [Actinomadura logoneensis]|uniref:Uncharacterized protein n=1 Tax=Actinomadura logoneensis TaxID=2293572 RepID=A0A372JAN8_9ACTN|nr:hypothetical protein DZF91_34970 [Actinomadura logoneensis]
MVIASQPCPATIGTPFMMYRKLSKFPLFATSVLLPVSATVIAVSAQGRAGATVAAISTCRQGPGRACGERANRTLGEYLPYLGVLGG